MGGRAPHGADRAGRIASRVLAAVVTLILAVVLVKVLVVDRLHEMQQAAAQPAALSGTVHPQTYGHVFMVGNVWTATLVLDGSGQIVNLTNNGTDGCIFSENIRDGDHLVVTGDPGQLSPGDVTDNGTNLGDIPVPDTPGGC